MLRGTIYLITDDGDGNQSITRFVQTIDDIETVERFQARTRIAMRIVSADARVEFGPIAPPWRKL